MEEEEEEEEEEEHEEEEVVQSSKRPWLSPLHQQQGSGWIHIDIKRTDA